MRTVRARAAEWQVDPTRIGVMDRGRLVQVGTPREIYENPLDVYVATRLGSPGAEVT